MPGALRPQQRHGQLGHLVVVAGPQRLGVDGDAERGEAGDVVGVDHLDVGEVVPAGGPAALRPEPLDRVEPAAHGAVADGVQVEVEPGTVEGGGHPQQHVAHDLRADRRKTAGPVGAAPLGQVGDDVVDRLEGGGARHPQRAGRPRGEQALPRQGAVGRADVAVAGVVPDDRLLPAGDAVGVEVPLRLEQPGALLLGGLCGQQGGDQVHGALVERNPHHGPEEWITGGGWSMRRA